MDLFCCHVNNFFLPGNILYGNSRRWLQVALWRLLLSGLYPVEFRDFFLGDIVSSLTYTMGNISFFFVYIHIIGKGHYQAKYHHKILVDQINLD